MRGVTLVIPLIRQFGRLKKHIPRIQLLYVVVLLELTTPYTVSVGYDNHPSGSSIGQGSNPPASYASRLLDGTGCVRDAGK